MNRNTLSLGRILGIPIGLDYSWFLIFALLTWMLATGYYPMVGDQLHGVLGRDDVISLLRTIAEVNRQ